MCVDNNDYKYQDATSARHIHLQKAFYTYLEALCTYLECFVTCVEARCKLEIVGMV